LERDQDDRRVLRSKCIWQNHRKGLDTAAAGFQGKALVHLDPFHANPGARLKVLRLFGCEMERDPFHVLFSTSRRKEEVEKTAPIVIVLNLNLQFSFDFHTLLDVRLDVGGQIGTNLGRDGIAQHLSRMVLNQCFQELLSTGGNGGEIGRGLHGHRSPAPKGAQSLSQSLKALNLALHGRSPRTMNISRV
jgi:hypothetical protein